MSRVNDGESGQMRTEDSPLDSVLPQPMVTLTRPCSVESGRGETQQGVWRHHRGSPSGRSAVWVSGEVLGPVGRVCGHGIVSLFF